MQQQTRSQQIDLYQHHRHSQIIQAEDGRLYQISEVSPRQLRRKQDSQRNQAANQFAYCMFGIGSVFVGLIALMIFGSILAAATRPAPPVPPPDVHCPWIGSCKVGQ
jgi:hypothetical protein